MAKTNWQDPKTSEMRSTHISGLQEAVGKIEESIGISSVAETNIPLAEVFISNDDRCRIFQAPEGKRNWLLSPAPVITKNGSIITQDFEIDYGGGTVIFTTPISESDVLTADATYTAKITGKQLSTEDYTTIEKNKLAGIDTGANKTVINNTLTSTSTTQALSAAQGKALKDAQDSHMADYEYQTPTILGTQIRLEKRSDTSILKFKLDSDLSGGEITISYDSGITSKPLVDVEGAAVTELGKGFVEVVENAVNFTYAPKGAMKDFFGDGSDGVLDTTSNITLPSILNGGVIIKQYSSIKINSGHKLTVSNPCQGLILYSQGDVIIDGDIDMSEQAGIAPSGTIVPTIITKTKQEKTIISSLLHFNGDVTDESGKIWTMSSGTPTFDATNKKFGDASISFTSSTWLKSPVSEDFNFGISDFTIDFWMRFPSTSASTRLGVFGPDYEVLPTNNYISLEKYSDSKLQLMLPLNGGQNRLLGTTILESDTWHHIAIVRHGKNINLYVDGILDGTRDNVSERNQGVFMVGKDLQGLIYRGQIDEFRVVKGKALFTSNFTPPTSEYAYVSPQVEEAQAFYGINQSTSLLQPLYGGGGGNGGSGGCSGGYTSEGGLGMLRRQNLGGFGGGGAGGDVSVTSKGGSIIHAEIGGGISAGIPSVTRGLTIVLRGINGSHGAGGSGGISLDGGSGTAYGSNGGTGFGGGGGGGGHTNPSSNDTWPAPSNGKDGKYAGGFVCIVSKGKIIINGSIKANGGMGGNGGAGLPTNRYAYGGGGGGGSGGGVVAIYHKSDFINNGTISVNGGSGGYGGSGVSGSSYSSGLPGTAGSVGTIHIEQIQGG